MNHHGPQMCKFFIFMTDSPFKKTHVTWSPCSGEETADDLPQNKKPVSIKIRISHNPFSQVRDSARNSKNSRTGKGFWVLSPDNVVPGTWTLYQTQMIGKSESRCCPSLWTCGFSTNSNQFPNTHGHLGVSSLLTLNLQRSQRPHRVRACSRKTVHTSSVDHESYGHLTRVACWLQN